jgi:hypothetical protein
MTILDFIIFSLATYRATRLITRDEIFQSLRNRIWNRFPPETTKTGYLLTCEWCSSVWLGLAFVSWYTIDASSFRFFAVALSLSATAGLLTAYENRD